MSDTDDTDLLLLIPPNFFLVQSSDSEDYEIRKTDFIREKNEIERAVVNDLISQVNELESRVCAIESSDCSCTVSCNEFCNRSFDSLDLKNSKLVHENSSQGFVQMPIRSQFTGSLDNVRPFGAIDNSNEKDSHKLRQPFSLPSTPSSVCYRHQFQSTRAVEPNDKVIAGDSNISSNSPSSTNHCSVNHKITLGVKQNTPEFLVAHKNRVSCNEPDIITKDHSRDVSDDFKILERGMEDDLSNQLNAKLNVNTDSFETTSPTLAKTNTVKMNDYNPLTKPLKNDLLEKNITDMSGKHLELTDVDTLLKEMEETQMEIEKKLKSRELHYNSGISKSDSCKRSGLYKVGEAINSVPDLGYGVREIFYHKSPETSNKDKNTKNSSIRTEGNDSIEEPFSQKKISSLGHSVESDYNKVRVGKNGTPLSSPHRSARFSCNQDNRESLLLKARKKIDFGSSKDNPITFIKPPGKIVQGRECFPKTNDNDHDLENHLSIGFDKSDGNSSADDRNNYEEGKKKILFPQRVVKSKIRHPRLLKEFDKRSFRNNKPLYKYGGGEKTLYMEQSASRSSNLMSLSDLWSSSVADSGIHTESDPVKLTQKLDEERYRRQHCERLILELQKRVLDDQERLAVAVQVDKEKDVAIKKLWDGWQHLASHWKELEEQRHALSKQLEAQSDAYESQAEDIKKKVDRWEKELSKALDLAAGYKEKCHVIAQEREEFMIDMEKKLQEALQKLSNAKDDNVKYMEENNKLTEKLNAIQSESEKDKQLVSEYQTKLMDVEQKLNQLETEISILREQKETLSLKLKDEMVRYKSVTEKNLSLQQTVDDYRKQEKILKDEVRSATERIELSRVELRALYQGQLEAVVKEKLREFQSQLNAAEAALRAELMSREKELAEQAARQCHTMAESHKLEIAGLNERHKSQLKAFLKKIQDLESQKMEVELKLKHETEGRSEIAQKLHSVMETQWRQALNIISNATASGDSKSQMEHTGRAYEDDMNLDLKKLEKSMPNSASSSNQDTAPFNKSDAMSTYRLANSTSPILTDMKRSNISEQQYLKKYIEMLLDRTPGNPVPRSLDKTASSLGPDDLHTLDSSNVTNDSFLSDNPATDKHVISKDKGKFSHRQSGLASSSERRQQLQNINRLLKHQPWK